MATEFEWNDAKAASSRLKHGIAFEHAVLAVVFTHRELDTIRLISARPASRKERETYANT